MNPILFADAISEIKNHPRLSIIHHPQLASSSKKLRKAVLPMLAIACFACSLLFMTFVRAGAFISGYAIAQLEHQQDELLRELQAFKLEEAVLKRPERIRKMATHELHLIQASQAPVIRLP